MKHNFWGYCAGVLGLCCALLLALFLPSWYIRWKDQQLFGQTTLSSRPVISVPQETDADAIRSRMLLLADPSGSLRQIDDTDEELASSSALLSTLYSSLAQWCGNGLLEFGTVSRLMYAAQIFDMSPYHFEADSGQLSLLYLHIENGEMLGDFFLESDGSYLYYACISAPGPSGAPVVYPFAPQDYCRADAVGGRTGAETDIAQTVTLLYGEQTVTAERQEVIAVGFTKAHICTAVSLGNTRWNEAVYAHYASWGLDFCYTLATDAAGTGSESGGHLPD